MDISKIIMIILKEDEPFVIPPKVMDFKLFLGIIDPYVIPENRISEEVDIIDRFRTKITKKLQGTIYPKYLHDDDEEEPEAKPLRNNRKKTRFEKLGLDKNQNMTPRVKLENQITRIIKHATREIRQFTANMKWSCIRFDDRIRPEIPLKIVTAMKNESDMEDLVN